MAGIILLFSASDDISSSLIFPDFGPISDLFRQKGPKMVRFYTQKSDFDKNGEK